MAIMTNQASLLAQSTQDVAGKSEFTFHPGANSIGFTPKTGEDIRRLTGLSVGQLNRSRETLVSFARDSQRLGVQKQIQAWNVGNTDYVEVHEDKAQDTATNIFEINCQPTDLVSKPDSSLENAIKHSNLA